MSTPVTSLVSLDDLKAQLNIDSGETSQDTELQGFLDAATAYVQFQTGPIIGKTFTETHNGGGPYIYVNNPPISSITSVTERVGTTYYTLDPVTYGTVGGAYTYQLEDPLTGRVSRMWNGFPAPFIGGSRNIQIVYVAGLDAVAGDVRMAVLEDARGLFQQTQNVDRPAFGGGGTGPESDTWNVGPLDMFPRLAALLAGPSRTPSVA